MFYYSDDFEEIKQDISSFRYEMLNQIKANEFNINEMAASVSSLLKYVKTIARNGNPSQEDDSPKEENEQSLEDETQNQDVPDTNDTGALWTMRPISCQSWHGECVFETGYLPFCKSCLYLKHQNLSRHVYEISWEVTIL